MAKYTVTVTDEDAVAAIDAEIARIAEAGGGEFDGDGYLSDFVTTQHRNLREGQLLAAAQAKVEADPDLMAFRAKQRGSINPSRTG